jgi:hypothetical protein
MVATLATLSEMVEEHVVVEKVLRCVPPRLKQIVLAISTCQEVENGGGRLRGSTTINNKMANSTSRRRNGTHGGFSARWRGKARVAVATAAVVAVEVITIMAAGAASVATGYRISTSAGDMESWATRTESGKPRQKRTKPTWSKRKKHR